MSLLIPVYLPHTMYLLVYPFIRKQVQPRNNFRRLTSQSDEFDYVTPDGNVVPRALGEAALRGRTAVLVGGLLVGIH